MEDRWLYRWRRRTIAMNVERRPDDGRLPIRVDRVSSLGSRIVPKEGGSIVDHTPCRCRDRAVADRRRVVCHLGRASAGQRCLRGLGRPGGTDLRPSRHGKARPLRVVFAAEHPVEGELSLIAPDGSVAAKSRQRLWRATVFLVCRSGVSHGGDLARDAFGRSRGRRVWRDHARDRRTRRRTATTGRDCRQRLATAQYMESRD